MVNFEECEDLTDAEIQTLLEAIPRDLFLRAIAGSNEALKQRFFKNLSAKAVQCIEGDLKQLRAAADDVENARREVVGILQGLIDKGTVAAP
ncbi:MAG: hypothetical protein K2Y37_01300 [Pirellulales bacterium]|nr:hypothetical protein [Pirellulales bacterium]